MAPPRIALVGPTPDGRRPRTVRRRPRRSTSRAGSRTSARSAARLQGRRALEIALAGGHGLLLLGPPGSGKTMLARTVPGLLPPLDDAAALAVDDRRVRGGRGPDHRASPPAAVPGPASHDLLRGDGRRRAADVARRGQPRRPRRPVPRRAARVRPRRPRGAPPAARGRARGDRAGRPVDDVPGPLPADRRDEPVPMRVRRRERPRLPMHRRPTVERYDRRVSGPLRDRIDLWVTMPRVPAASIMGGPEPETSEVVGARIAAARTHRSRRAARRAGR